MVRQQWRQDRFEWHEHFHDGHMNVSDYLRYGWRRSSMLMAIWGHNVNLQKNVNKTVGFFGTPHLHIHHWWSKSTLPSTDGFGRSAIFPGFVTTQFLLLLHPVARALSRLSGKP
jgi:hypothetical protein